MNGAVSGVPFGFRSLLCFVVCIQSVWARPEMYFSERTPHPLFSDHQTQHFHAFVVHRPGEIDTVSTAPKIHLCSREEKKKRLLSVGQSTCAPLGDWKSICDPQHIFWKWPFRMSNEGYANIILHLTHIHEPGGGNQWGLILGFMLEMDAIKQTFSSRYSIDWKSDLDSYFDIDPVEGTISTNELLDRESIAQHNISIVATKLSKYDNEIDRDSRGCRCPSLAIICVKDLTRFYSSQYSIPFCWKGL